MQFYNDSALIFLAAVPAALFLFWWRNWRKKILLSKFADPEMISKLSPHRSVQKERLKSGLILLALLLCILALARPQWGEEKKKIERKGVDIIFVLDTSLSMLAEDIKPSRINKARIEIRNFIKKLKGDRVALVAFAGSSFLQCPLTLDYGAFLLFLDAVKVGYIPDPGSSIADAIRAAITSFPKGDKKYRVMVLFSDGEETAGGAPALVERAKEKGVRIYTIGVATRDGGPIPLRSAGAGKGKVGGFKKDRMGELVVTKLNNELLEKIAKETGGLYFPVTAGEKELDLIYTHIRGLGKKTFKAQEITEKEEHFQVFLVLALLALILELLLTDRRKATVGT